MTALVLAGSAGAQAQGLVYSAHEGHWTIWNTALRCLAVNRPLSEANQTPYNMLSLSLRRGGSFVMRVSFWPGAFRPDAAVRLSMHLANRNAPTVVAAKAVDDFSVETTEPLSADFLRALRIATTDTLDIDAGLRTGLSFDVSRIGFVMARLENCAQLLPPP